jgi:hypothetical protein
MGWKHSDEKVISGRKATAKECDDQVDQGKAIEKRIVMCCFRPVRLIDDECKWRTVNECVTQKWSVSEVRRTRAECERQRQQADGEQVSE